MGYETVEGGKRGGKEKVGGNGRRMRILKKQVSRHKHLTESLGKEGGEGHWFKCY